MERKITVDDVLRISVKKTIVKVVEPSDEPFIREYQESDNQRTVKNLWAGDENELILFVE